MSSDTVTLLVYPGGLSPYPYVWWSVFDKFSNTRIYTKYTKFMYSFKGCCPTAFQKLEEEKAKERKMNADKMLPP